MTKLTVGWEYYSSHFNKLTQEEFEKVEYEASMTVTRRCRPYVLATVLSNSEDVRNDILKDTVCYVAEALSEQYSHNIGTGINSVSNDGYSESYSITKREDADKEIIAVIRKWLSGTGMAGAL